MIHTKYFAVLLGLLYCLPCNAAENQATIFYPNYISRSVSASAREAEDLTMPDFSTFTEQDWKNYTSENYGKRPKSATTYKTQVEEIQEDLPIIEEVQAPIYEHHNHRTLEPSQLIDEDLELYNSDFAKTSVAICVPVYKNKPEFTRDLVNSIKANYDVLKEKGCKLHFFFRVDDGEETSATQVELLRQYLKETGLEDAATIEANKHNYGVGITRSLLLEDSKKYLGSAQDNGGNSFITFVDSDDVLNRNYLLYTLLAAFKYDSNYVNATRAIRNFDDAKESNRVPELTSTTCGLEKFQTYKGVTSSDICAQVVKCSKILEKTQDGQYDWKVIFGNSDTFETFILGYKDLAGITTIVPGAADFIKENFINLEVIGHHEKGNDVLYKRDITDYGLYCYRGHPNSMLAQECEETKGLEYGTKEYDVALDAEAIREVSRQYKQIESAIQDDVLPKKATLSILTRLEQEFCFYDPNANLPTAEEDPEGYAKKSFEERTHYGNLLINYEEKTTIFEKNAQLVEKLKDYISGAK